MRDHLFVTTRVATRDGNFLIGAPFVSDRPRHLFFRPTKSVLGPVDVFVPFSTIFTFFSVFFWGGLHKSRNEKSALRRPLGRWGPGPTGPTTTLRAQRQPYRALYNPYIGPYIGPYFGPYFPFVGCPIFPLWAAPGPGKYLEGIGMPLQGS